MTYTYKCIKHGVLEASDRVIWFRSVNEKKWCRFCVEEMMDKFCCEVIGVKEDSINQKGE